MATETPPLVGRTAAADDDALGAAYRTATINELVQRDPYSVDPAVVERGLAGHANTQNALAEALTAAGLDPRSPRADEPNFDLAWRRDESVFVAEIKSTTTANEERQLRLGLGQVLRYRALLQRRYDAVCAVLVAEQPPADHSWIELCDELDVLFVWPAILDRLTRVAPCDSKPYYYLLTRRGSRGPNRSSRSPNMLIPIHNCFTTAEGSLSFLRRAF